MPEGLSPNMKRSSTSRGDEKSRER